MEDRSIGSIRCEVAGIHLRAPSQSRSRVPSDACGASKSAHAPNRVCSALTSTRPWSAHRPDDLATGIRVPVPHSVSRTPGLSTVRFRSKRAAGRLSPRASGSLLWGHMQLRLFPVFLQRSLLRVFSIALNSCQSHETNSGPSIEVTPIPPAVRYGRESDGTISARVRSAQPNEQIVMYEHCGQWWLQPCPRRSCPLAGC